MRLEHPDVLTSITKHSATVYCVHLSPVKRIQAVKTNTLQRNALPLTQPPEKKFLQTRPH